MAIKLDAFDRKILRALQRDGRLSNVALAEEVGLSPSPCLRRVRLLEQAGVIEGYSARVNRRKLGLDLTAFVAVNIQAHSAGAPQLFKDAVRVMPEVIACHTTSGDHDFLLQVAVENLDAYQAFVERLIKAPGVLHIRSSFAYEAVKDGAALPIA